MKCRLPILLAVFVGMTVPALAADDGKEVALTDVPTAAQATITNQVADGKLGEIELTKEHGDASYNVTFTPKTGDDRDFTVADDGTLLSTEVSLADLSAAVQKTIEVQANGWKLESIDKSVDESEPSYDVEVTTNGDGGEQTKDFTVAENGDLLSTSVMLTNTPAAVQATIKTQMGSGSLESLDETFDPDDGDQFVVTVLGKTGAEKNFTLTATGEMYSEEVALDKVSAGALKTIREKIGNGRVLHIEKSLIEKKDGVLPYHVEGRKDGKEFDFSVGPHGRFLGADE